MNEKILEALKTLEVNVDAQWTQDGLVNLNAFKFVLGGDTVTREQIDAVAPGFTRQNAATYFQEATVNKVEVETSYDTVEDVLIQVINSLRQKLENPSELSDEALSALHKEGIEIRNHILAARDEFTSLVEKGLSYLTDLHGEVTKRKPVETIAEQVKRMHDANADTTYEIDKGRTRTIQPFPPLIRK